MVIGTSPREVNPLGDVAVPVFAASIPLKYAATSRCSVR